MRSQSIEGSVRSQRASHLRGLLQQCDSSLYRPYPQRFTAATTLAVAVTFHPACPVALNPIGKRNPMPGGSEGGCSRPRQ